MAGHCLFRGGVDPQYRATPYAPMNAAELQALADDWLEKYHFYRPPRLREC